MTVPVYPGDDSEIDTRIEEERFRVSRDIPPTHDSYRHQDENGKCVIDHESILKSVGNQSHNNQS